MEWPKRMLSSRRASTKKMDDDGDTVYIKSKKFSTEKTTDENRADVSRKTRADEDESKKVEDLMDTWWADNQAGITMKTSTHSQSDGVNKKPAGKIIQFTKAQRDGEDGSSSDGGSTDDDDKKKKKPKGALVENREQAQRMCGDLAKVSTKVLSTLSKIHRTTLSVPLMTQLKARRKELEEHRKALMATAVSKRMSGGQIKKEVVAAAKPISAAAHLMKMAKPFMKES